MRDLRYRLYGWIYKFFRILPMKKKKVVLYMSHNCHFKGNLYYVYEEMKRRDSSFRFIIVSKHDLLHPEECNKLLRILKKIKGILYFYVALNYHFATAEYIMLNDNFLPLAYMPMRKQTKLVQLWHGIGVFKRFGLSSDKDPYVRKMVGTGNKQVTHLFASSGPVAKHYEEAFGVGADCIYPVGIPITDYYFDDNKKKQSVEAFYQAYPTLKNKKIILYTPTFRDTEEENNALLTHFDVTRLKEALGEDYQVLVRFHPQVKPSKCVQSDYINVTDYEDVKALFLVSDCLVTDYSSTMVEYSLLDKPIIFYAYDLEKYDRGFYYDYRNNVPGRIAVNIDELIAAIKQPDDDMIAQRRDRFVKMEFAYQDCQATKRVVDRILNK